MAEQTWEEVLQGILVKNPESLTQKEREFINARSSYLTPSQRKKFAGVLVNQEQFLKEAAEEPTEADVKKTIKKDAKKKEEVDDAEVMQVDDMLPDELKKYDPDYSDPV